MASTKASGAKTAWTYTTSEGTPRSFAVAAKACYVEDVTDGAKYGGAAAEPGTPGIPNELRMRKVLCVDENANGRYVVAYTTTATIWTTPGTEITLDMLGVDTVFQATDVHRPEKIGRKGKNPAAAA
jgi:hypothetical protein